MDKEPMERELGGSIMPDPTAAERLVQVEADVQKVKELLEQLWLQRHMLYSAIRELKTIQRNVELAKATIGKPTP